MNLREGVTKKIIRAAGAVAPFFDIVFAPLTFLSVVWFRIVRYWGVKRLPVTRKIFLRLGLFPIVNHYYEPLFDYRKIPSTPPTVSHLDFNDATQLSFLRSLNYGGELLALPNQKQGAGEEYYYGNGSFNSGDAELYYSILRKNKPRKILEIGSGFSTLAALKAIARNTAEDSGYSCDLTCVEPYEMPYLEKLNVHLIRKKIEELDTVIFNGLQEGDVFFVDSSHIIRPGGDVNYLILKMAPFIKPGVWIHFHDIFLPKEYPIAWLRDEFRMWNEQYLLEAFLIANHDFEIVCALNYLNNKYPEEVARAFPVLGREPDRDPGSFWIRKK
jgi:hypothetical protein